MIDPITALAGIQAAVGFIKKVQSTVDDVASLGPALGKYFDAKTVATRAVVEAKRSNDSSAMGAAIQIEMALDQTKQFEKELQFLFMQAGKIDVWNNIKKRAAAMELEAAKEAKREKEAAIRRRKKMQENLELSLAIVLLILTASGIVWGLVQFIQYCNANSCGV
jgi:lysophospholipase L1-like esterase